MKPATLAVAVPAGLTVALLCVPYVLLMSPVRELQTIRLAFLVPVSIIFAQVSVAWTPLTGGTERFMRPRQAMPLGRLLLVAVAVAAAKEVCLHPLIARLAPERLGPESWTLLLVRLPWVTLFQPLAFVAATYAFAARLLRRRSAALAAVVLAYQAVQMAQFGTAAPLWAVAGLILFSGVYALILALSYRFCGLAGPAAIVLLSQWRYAYLLLRA